MVFESFIAIAQNLITEFSYAAIFITSLISTSTIFLPFPIYTIVFFAAGLGLNPLLVGITAGIGSAIGELTGYFIGAGGKHLLEKKSKDFLKKHKWLENFRKLFFRYEFTIIGIAAFLPFPFDFVGILAGSTNYDVKKFLLATALGKTLKTTLIAYAGFVAIPYIELFLGVV